MRIELIKWIDARSIDGWTDDDDKRLHPSIIETVGSVVKEDDEAVCLAGSCDVESPISYSCIMIIPKVCILERWEITD